MIDVFADIDCFYEVHKLFFSMTDLCLNMTTSLIHHPSKTHESAASARPLCLMGNGHSVFDNG